MKRLLLIALVALLLQNCKIGKNYRGTDFVQPDKYAQQVPGLQVEYDSINTDSLALSTADL